MVLVVVFTISEICCGRKGSTEALSGCSVEADPEEVCSLVHLSAHVLYVGFSRNMKKGGRKVFFLFVVLDFDWLSESFIYNLVVCPPPSSP
jgi:hypothetical protein